MKKIIERLEGMGFRAGEIVEILNRFEGNPDGLRFYTLYRRIEAEDGYEYI